MRDMAKTTDRALAFCFRDQSGEKMKLRELDG